MARYPRPVRDARIKCIACNAPVVETVDDGYHCVDCGGSPVTSHSEASSHSETSSHSEPSSLSGADD